MSAISRAIYILPILFALGFSPSTFAKDFGIKGALHEVTEQPFLEMIKERLGNLDLERLKEEQQNVAREAIENPTPIEGINPATKSRYFYYDPTYIVPKDIYLPCGKLLYAAGTKVNPLDKIEFDRRLIFIDGREERQAEWLKHKLLGAAVTMPENHQTLIILVAGSPLRIEQELRNQGLESKVYFDQMGEITSRFGIKATPAVAEQDGKLIKIIEIKLEAKKEADAYNKPRAANSNNDRPLILTINNK